MEFKDLKVDIRDFEEWLKFRGYDQTMHEDNFKIFLDIGLAGLFFTNSNLFITYIFNKIGLPSERISPRVRLELGRRISGINVDKDSLEIKFINP